MKRREKRKKEKRRFSALSPDESGFQVTQTGRGSVRDGNWNVQSRSRSLTRKRAVETTVCGNGNWTAASGVGNAYRASGGIAEGNANGSKHCSIIAAYYGGKSSALRASYVLCRVEYSQIPKHSGDDDDC
jgi:hypothetical protein